MKKNTNNIIMVLVILVVIVALVNIVVTFVKVSDFNKKITGFASGYVNLTIATEVSINLTTSVIDFGTGAVATGPDRANLTTIQAGDANVSDGNWSGSGVTGIVIQNIGNINCTLTLTAEKNASDLFGNETDTANTPAYNWNVTNKDAGACHGGNPLNVWTIVNKSAVKFCDQFSPLSDQDELWLDVHLSVPYDGVTGYILETITIAAGTP